MKHIKEFEQFVAEAKSYSGKFKKVYDNLNKGDEVTIKYGSSISRNNEVTFIVKKGKTTVGKAKVERITLVNKANPKGVKYYLYNRNGNISLAIGDMGATIDDIQMNESLKESISELMESETLAESSYPSKLTEGKTSAVYTDPKTGKGYDLQYVSSKKRWELDIMKKGASMYSSAITTIKRDTLAEIQEWLDGYKIDSSWTKFLQKVK